MRTSLLEEGLRARVPGQAAAPTVPTSVAILADTHGWLDDRVLAEALACDHVVHAGDVGGASVLAALGGAHAGIVAVRGNNDTPGKWRAEDHARLTELPLVARLDLPGGPLVVVHGHRAGPASGRHGRLRRDYPEARLVVYGHSHRWVIDRDADPWVVNPGAAGRTRTFGGPSYVRLVASRLTWDVELRRFAPAEPRRASPQAAPLDYSTKT